MRETQRKNPQRDEKTRRDLDVCNKPDDLSFSDKRQTGSRFQTKTKTTVFVLVFVEIVMYLLAPPPCFF